MKKLICTIIISFLIITFLSTTVSATDTDINKVWDNVDGKTEEYLEDLGITEVTFDEIFDLSPTRVISFLFDLAFNTGITIHKKVITVIIIILIISIANAFIKESNHFEQLVSFVGIMAIFAVIIEPISRIITDVAAGIKTSAIFVNSYLPVMTAIIVASRNPSLAITYNSFSVFLSSFIASVCDKFFMPFISVVLSFNILSSFSFENFREKILAGCKRIIIVILSMFSTVYTGLLTTQSLLATSSDSITLRGIKFISGAFVPVVGAGVGDAISSVFSSFLIMKNTLGVFVIIVIILINLPVIIELLIWYFAMQICSIVSSMLGIKNITDILDGISTLISLLNIILFFVTFVLVISTGVIIMMGK